METETDMYRVLGVGRDAGAEDVKRAYRKAVRAHHPDHNPGADPEAFRRLTEAYETLSDPEARARYDETGETAGQAARVAKVVFDEACKLLILKVCEGAEDYVAEALRELAERQADLDRIEESHNKLVARLELAAKRLRRKDGQPSAVADRLKAEAEAHRDQVQRVIPAKRKGLVAMDELLTQLEVTGLRRLTDGSLSVEDFEAWVKRMM